MDSHETMKTAVFRGVKNIALEECERPRPTGSKVLIKVDCCALCTWEQRVYTGVNKVEFPFIGGHEVAATIVELGPETNTDEWAVGDKVVCGVTLACRECYLCKSGNEQSCTHFDHQALLEGLPYHGMGGLSEYLAVPTSYLFKYSNVTPHEACMIEPLSCVVHSVEAGDVQLGDYVLVIGCGIMGLLHVQAARLRGAAVIACDTDEKRLAMAGTMGANYLINPDREDQVQKVIEYTQGRKAQVVFDTVPFPSVLQKAYECVGNTGAVVLYSSIHPKPGEDKLVPVDAGWMHSWSIRTIGTANSNDRDFIRASTMVSEGLIDMKPFNSGVFPAEEVDAAFQAATSGGAFRVIVDF